MMVGTPYIDFYDTMTVKNLDDPSYSCEVKFEARGWLSKECCKVLGRVAQKVGGRKE